LEPGIYYTTDNDGNVIKIGKKIQEAWPSENVENYLFLKNPIGPKKSSTRLRLESIGGKKKKTHKKSVKK